MIPLSIPYIQGNEWKYIKECLDTQWVSSAGRYVDLFEERFKTYLNVACAVSTMNGTAALHTALLCLGIQAGDEVLVPSMTFISTVNAIVYVGAKPVFVDVCRDNYGMDAEKLEAMITPKTKVILPVHLYGCSVDMQAIMKVAKKHNLYVIEDATESLGAVYKGEHTGTMGHIGCFSFNGNKLITTGAGGMLVTNDLEIGKRAKYLTNQAKTLSPSGGFYHEEVGYNFRMPNLLAAMGVAQLENIEFFVETKRRNAALYQKLLQEATGVVLPNEANDVQNVYWLYSVLIDDSYFASRDELIQILKLQGIEARPFFMPIHQMPPYQNCRHGDLTVTAELAQKGLNLPSSVGLTEEDIKKVCAVIAENS